VHGNPLPCRAIARFGARGDGHRGAVLAIALTPDGKTAASAGADGTVRVWDTPTGKELRTYAEHHSPVCAIAISCDARIAASTEQNGTLHLWELQTGKLLHRLVPRDDRWYGLAVLSFSHDGESLVSWRRGSSVHIFDVQTGKEVRQLQLHPLPASMAFSPDKKLMATARWDLGWGALVSVRSFATGQELYQIEGDDRAMMYCLAFSADGKLLAGGRRRRPLHPINDRHCVEKEIRVWEVASGQEIGRMRCRSAAPLLFSPDNRALINTSPRSTDGQATRPALHFWDWHLGRDYAEFGEYAADLGCLALSRDGRILLSGSADGTVLVWDATSFPKNRGGHRRIDSKELPTLWEQLNGENAANADHALCTLAEIPETTVTFLRTRLSPISPADPHEIAQLIEALNSDRYAEREKASARLENLAELAAPDCRKALVNTSSAEVRRRVTRLLNKLESPLLSGQRLLAVRVGALLERIGTPEARRLLEHLATGASEARLTHEAKASLDRLALHSP
jgi:hypothetical protein